MKGNKALYTAFIIGFALLYVATAVISLCHAVEFFMIGNAGWMAVTLAAVFEVGQMTVLSSILLSKNRNNAVSWLLLVILTCVQVIGNVYSVFKYMSLSETDYYVFLQKPLIDWWLTGVPQETIMVIISWITGALLPIVALLMTSMVAGNMKMMSDEKKTHESETVDNEEYATEYFDVDPNSDPIPDPIPDPNSDPNDDPNDDTSGDTNGVTEGEPINEPINEPIKEEPVAPEPQKTGFFGGSRRGTVDSLNDLSF